MDEKKDQKSKPKSLLKRWQEWVSSRGKTRPETSFSWGKGMEKITISLPKSVYQQMRLVSLKDSMNAYPYDYSIRESFLKEILPLTQYCGNAVSDPEILGYARCEVLISMYCDLLLAPLSQRVQEMTRQTIMTILPTMPE